MGYYERLGLEEITQSEELTDDDLRFIGMLRFLERDSRYIAKVERVKLHRFMYDVNLKKNMSREAIERLFEEHAFPMPVEVRELPVKEGLTDTYLIFRPGKHFYNIFVHNPQ